VHDALAESELDPGTLTLEITETALMRDADASARRLGALEYLGVRLAIDDFWTGYSSLAYVPRGAGHRRGWLSSGRLRQRRLRADRLKQLDRVARRVLDEHLLAADAGDDLVAKAGAVAAQLADGRLDV
jgi:predicted amino acid dehydrogenase